jgi:hypothetical protein
MNCKPGDLAVVVSGSMPEDSPTLGAIVRLTKIDPDWWEPVWEYEGRLLIDAAGVELIALADRFLRPIHQDGITDEEVRELYAPKLPELA